MSIMKQSKQSKQSKRRVLCIGSGTNHPRLCELLEDKGAELVVLMPDETKHSVSLTECEYLDLEEDEFECDVCHCIFDIEDSFRHGKDQLLCEGCNRCNRCNRNLKKDVDRSQPI